MNKKDNRHIIDIMFVIALFSMFVLSAIFLISIGANIYSKTMTNMETNFNSRTAVAYINEKIRQSDIGDSINIGKLEDLPAIVITSTINDKDYITYIYEHEGMLKELMIRSDITLSPSAGQNMIEVSGFSLDMINDSLIKCSLTMKDDESYEFFININSDTAGEGGVHE